MEGEIKSVRQSKTELNESNPVKIGPIEPKIKIGPLAVIGRTKNVQEIRMRSLVGKSGNKNCKTIGNHVE